MLREFTNIDISVHSPLSVIQSFRKFGGKPPTHTFFNKKKLSKSIFSSGSKFKLELNLFGGKFRAEFCEAIIRLCIAPV